MKKVLLAAAFTAFAGSASAATIDFSGSVCDPRPWDTSNVCNHWDRISQDHGDIAGEVDVVYDGNTDTVELEGLRYWSTDYNTLTGVGFGYRDAGGRSISLVAEDNYDVTLTGFDISPNIWRDRDMLLQVIDMATGTVLLEDTYNPTATTGFNSYAGSWTSSVGLQIFMGTDSWDVAIDNIEFTSAFAPDPLLTTDLVTFSTPLTPMPLPAGGLLLLSGLAGLAAAKRKFKRS